MSQVVRHESGLEKKVSEIFEKWLRIAKSMEKDNNALSARIAIEQIRNEVLECIFQETLLNITDKKQYARPA